MLPPALKALLEPPEGLEVDFTQPHGAPALVPFKGISWQIFANPLSVFIGGIAAVILELAEPSVREGVWQNSSFKKDPLLRLRRTGFAALITVYAPRHEAERMIARVVDVHDQIAGTLPDGAPYRANDPRLLTWVHATALWGFCQSYHYYARDLSRDEVDRAFHEGTEAAYLYGANHPPANWLGWEMLLEKTPLEDSPVITEFLEVMETAPILPPFLRPLQKLLVRAAVEIVPTPIRHFPSLENKGLRKGEAFLLRTMGKFASLLYLPQLPAAQAGKRFET